MKTGSDESHFNVSVILCGWKVARSVHKKLSRERRVGVGNQTHVIHLPAFCLTARPSWLTRGLQRQCFIVEQVV